MYLIIHVHVHVHIHYTLHIHVHVCTYTCTLYVVCSLPYFLEVTGNISYNRTMSQYQAINKHIQ